MERLNGLLRRVPTWAVYIAGVLPFVWLVVQLFTGGLGVDPVKVLEHRMGEIGLQLIVAGLMVTPLRRYAGLNLFKFRRAIGLLAFFYITMHLAVWLTLDIQFFWGEIWTDILKRPYITIGMAGFVLMLPLALTSNNWSVKRMGAMAWRRVHKLIYVVAILGAVHFVMLVKGYPLEPYLYLTGICGLLLMRLKFSRKVVTTR